jgi:hypothetical protein
MGRDARPHRDPALARLGLRGIEEEIRSIYEDEATASRDEGVLRFNSGDRFTLEERAGGTVLRVTRTAPSLAYDEIDEGWTTFVQQLRFFLERHPGDDRRTLWLAGHARAREVSPHHSLGLGAVASVPIGRPYKAHSAPGDVLEGEVWFRSLHQTGISVDVFGDGLLVLTRHPAATSADEGADVEQEAMSGAQALITTYGLDDPSFRRLRERWTAWWSAEYEDTSTAASA